MQHAECRECAYWDGYLGMCNYADMVGRTRLSLHGGNWRKLYVGKCAEWKQCKKKRKKKAGYAWRELPAIPAKSRRKR